MYTKRVCPFAMGRRILQSTSSKKVKKKRTSSRRKRAKEAKTRKRLIDFTLFDLSAFDSIRPSGGSRHLVPVALGEFSDASSSTRTDGRALSPSNPRALHRSPHPFQSSHSDRLDAHPDGVGGHKFLKSASKLTISPRFQTQPTDHRLQAL